MTHCRAPFPLCFALCMPYQSLQHLLALFATNPGQCIAPRCYLVHWSLDIDWNRIAICKLASASCHLLLPLAIISHTIKAKCKNAFSCIGFVLFFVALERALPYRPAISNRPLASVIMSFITGVGRLGPALPDLAFQVHLRILLVPLSHRPSYIHGVITMPARPEADR